MPPDSSEHGVFLIEVAGVEFARELSGVLGLADPRPSLVWVDGEAEVLVESVEATLGPGLILVDLRLRTDETGSERIVVPYRIGGRPDDAALVAVTESPPRGNPVLAARWGRPIQNHVLDAILDVGARRWNARTGTIRFKGSLPRLAGMFTDGRSLSYLFARPVPAREIATVDRSVLDLGRTPLSVVSIEDLGGRPAGPILEPPRGGPVRGEVGGKGVRPFDIRPIDVRPVKPRPRGTEGGRTPEAGPDDPRRPVDPRRSPRRSPGRPDPDEGGRP